MIKKLLFLLVLLLTATTGAWADSFSADAYAANATLNGVSVTANQTVTINEGVTVTVNNGLSIQSSATLTVTGGGTLVVNGANGADGQNEGLGVDPEMGEEVWVNATPGGNGNSGIVIDNGGNLIIINATIIAVGGKGGQGGKKEDESFAANGNDGNGFSSFPAIDGAVLSYSTNGTDYTEYASGDKTLYRYMKAVAAAAAPPTYSITLAEGTEDATNWQGKAGEGEYQSLPLEGVAAGTAVSVKYSGKKKVKSVKAVKKAKGKTVDLSTLTADYEAQDGDVLTGETTSSKVTIAAGATVTLDGVNISKYGYCIKCLGDATIILKDGSTNTLTGTGSEYPALSIGDANTTLTIQGSTGVLNVTSGNYCAGIGGGYSNTNSACGNIRIEGGVITAQGGHGGSGIGSDAGTATCGDIIITGGTITAKGGSYAAGIGTGNGSMSQVVCGNITIANTVTKVTATAGEEAPYSIGKGYGDNATCGTVTIGGTKYWENNAAVNGGDTYLATSPLIYDPSN